MSPSFQAASAASREFCALAGAENAAAVSAKSKFKMSFEGRANTAAEYR